MAFNTSHILIFSPEIFLSLFGLVMLLLLAVFKEKLSFNMVGMYSAVAFFASIVLVFLGNTDTEILGQIVSDPISRFGKVTVLFCAFISCFFGISYYSKSNKKTPEYFVLLIFSVVGLLFMCSSRHLLAIYLAVELFSLSAYILTSFNQSSLRSTESGLKYFVLGGLSSCILLFGISLIYGSTGSLQFMTIANYLQSETNIIGASLGLVFVITGLAFKLSTAPFHMWAPDVYEGAPTPVTAFFATAPKIATLIIFMRLLYVGFPDLILHWQIILTFIAIMSMFVGAISAIWQTNLKRLMAYSSISHMGYALIGVVAGTKVGISASLVYLIIYLITTIGMFCAILSLNKNNQLTEKISDLNGMRTVNLKYAIFTTLFLLSLSGIPVAIGFWGKLIVFQAALNANLFVLPLCGAVASVISAFYYLFIIKRIWFDEPKENVKPQPLMSINIIMTITAIIVCFGLFIPFLLSNLTIQAAFAAATLF